MSKSKLLYVLAIAGSLGVAGCSSSSSGTGPDESGDSSATDSGISSATIGTSSAGGVGASSSSALTVASSSSVVAQDTTSQVVADTTGNPVLTFSASGLSIANNNSCVIDSGSTVWITCAGNYYLTGSTASYEVIVAADTSAKVYLYLNGLSLSNSSDAAVYAQSADKVFLMLVDGTDNSLADASARSRTWSYTKDGTAVTDTTGAAVYAKVDLTVKGAGKLTVTGNYNNGIHTSKDLKVNDVPTLVVTAPNNALKGKNSVEIKGGYLTLASTAGDGIKSDEDDATELAEGKGHILITGGEFTIQAADKCINASNYIHIADSVSTPVFSLTAGSGTPNTTKYDSMNGSSSAADTGNYPKGIKTDSTLTIDAGSFVINAVGNCLTGKKVHVNGGVYAMAGRRGVHADDTLFVAGGTMAVTNSYEGFEAAVIYMQGGVTSIYSTDDGWNASNTDNTSLTPLIIVSGGYHYVKTGSGDTDGIDSNGDIYFRGGVLVVEAGGNIIDKGDSGNAVYYEGGVFMGFGSQVEGVPTAGNPLCSGSSGSSGGRPGSSTTTSGSSVSAGTRISVGSSNVLSTFTATQSASMFVYFNAANTESVAYTGGSYAAGTETYFAVPAQSYGEGGSLSNGTSVTLSACSAGGGM